jgi:antitoxin HigA-1
MVAKKLQTIHPGEVLQHEFIEPMGLTQSKLAQALHVPARRINEIALGKRRITADTALRLSLYFKNSPQFWLGLQMDYDLDVAEDKMDERLKRKIQPEIALWMTDLSAIALAEVDDERFGRMYDGNLNNHKYRELKFRAHNDFIVTRTCWGHPCAGAGEAVNIGYFTNIALFFSIVAVILTTIYIKKVWLIKFNKLLLIIMWHILEHKDIFKAIKKVPPQVTKKYELWKGLVFRHGPQILKEFPGFNDELLKGDRTGQRSSRLSLQYRVIYEIEDKIVTVYVVEITPHKY